MASLHNKRERLLQKSASTRGMQAPTSKVPTVKSRDSVQKQRSDPWAGPSLIATYVRCLRLLDLDQLEDWPVISEDTFSTISAKQNLQSRIKCVEWSLYRLFELWSPSETRDKLRPFFPPLTPLQSLNLRAALYRCLTELKKNAVLGKEVVLRKTMLDECKGEKFEEVVSAFAMIVLRRFAVARKDARLELASSDRLTRQKQAQILPLIIAHRRSLQKQLSRHRKIQGQAEVYCGLLADRHVSVEDRRAVLGKSPVSEDGRIAGIREDIADLWVGDERWAEILLSGPARHRDQFLEDAFETGWKAVQNGEDVEFGHQTDLLQKLDARIASQETRLRKWKTFAASLQHAQAQKARPLPTATPSEKGKSAMPQFDMHQSLHLPENPLLARFVEHVAPTASVHKDLLVSMEAEIDSLGRQKPVKSDVSREVQETGSGNPIKNEQMDLNRLGRSQEFIRSGLRTSPTRLICKRGALESKVVSPAASSPLQDPSALQLEPISIFGQHVESDGFEIKTSKGEVSKTGFPQRVSEIKSARANVSGAPPKSFAYQQSFGATVIPVERPSLQGELEEPVVTPSSLTHTTNTPTSLPEGQHDRGLEERTELSVSDYHVIPTDKAFESATLEQRGKLSIRRPPTLLDRTRQSMSLLPNPKGRAGTGPIEKRATAKQKRLSQAVPVNQYGTPRKMTEPESSRLETTTPTSGSSTPCDELFSDAAAYDSVFKSRPRVALSPTLSPDRSGMGLEDFLGGDLADLTQE